MVLVCLGWAAPLAAQAPGVHYRFNAATPPGAIGSWQLQRGGPLPGYFQPVEIRLPPGALVSLAVGGQFEPPSPGPIVAGMLVGRVYRLRVGNIPFQPGFEVFPTIEVIDRLYPPLGEQWRFPVVVEISPQDLDLALAGKLVTRVIYLEDPQTAVPVHNPAEQPWFDVPPGENPLLAADRLGRPMAILRLGGRVPIEPATPDLDFLFGSPPLLQAPGARGPGIVPARAPIAAAAEGSAAQEAAR